MIITRKAAHGNMASHYFKEGVFQSPKGHEGDIAHLKDWLKGQAHLPALTDEHLYLFLNSCIYQLTRTKQTIENYYTLRTHATDLFGNRDASLPEIQAFLDICNLVHLNCTTAEGYQVFLFRLVDYDASKFNFPAAVKMFFMFIDMKLSELGLHPGYIAIFDLTGLTVGHLARFTLSALKKALTYVQDCQPVTLKGIHLINTVPFIDKLMSLLKPFMNNELLGLMQFHGPPEEMDKIVPLERFPSEYGGKGESAVAVHARDRAKMIEFHKWYQEEEKLKVDESKRQGKKHPYTEVFGGAEGSFRKLDID